MINFDNLKWSDSIDLRKQKKMAKQMKQMNPPQISSKLGSDSEVSPRIALENHKVDE